MNLAVHFKPIKRTIIVAAIALAVVAGVVFAILQDRGVLGGSTITTASADLLVSTDGINYHQTVPGFSFNGIIPGGYPAPAGGYSVYLKNTGSTTLDLSLTLNTMPPNPAGANLGKLNLGLTDADGVLVPRGFTLASLVGTGQPVEGELTPGATRHYMLQALAADDAVSGTTISGIDLAFVGTARDPNTP